MNEQLQKARALAKADLLAALYDWKDAGGSVERVMYALEQLIDLHIEAAQIQSE